MFVLYFFLPTIATPRKVENLQISTDPIRVSWDHRNGTFDLLHYRVQACNDNMCMNTTTTENFIIVVDPEINVVIGNGTVRVSVFAESHCRESGDAEEKEVLIGNSGKLRYSFSIIIIILLFCYSAHHFGLGASVVLGAAMIAYFVIA